jgi:hypothetical protein
MAPHGRFLEPASTSRPARARRSRLNRSILSRPHRTGRPCDPRPRRPDRSHGGSRRASGAHDPPTNRMLQLCNFVNAMRAFFGHVAAQVLRRTGEKTSHKSPRGRHCAGPSVKRGSAARVARPTAGLVLGPRPGSIRPAEAMPIVRSEPHPARHRLVAFALPAAAGPVESGARRAHRPGRGRTPPARRPRIRRTRVARRRPALVLPALVRSGPVRRCEAAVAGKTSCIPD